ncbi:MAG: tRNA (adenosine(37)-N6)-dimethylallyltransferase MiaA [bacterium]|nr:tRNA (adenosine(37)-N6)-dimethylallyltransferase MiaA [bacterium]
MTKILCIAGPTASGKSARAVEIALRGFVNPSFDDGFTKPIMGEIISVDSRQVYRGLDIGTEKITVEEMRGIPHHLINIRDVDENYSAGDFVTDATRLIEEITARGKLPILVGGTHFYFDALLHGLPMGTDANPALRAELEALSSEELYARVRFADARRAAELDPQNRRRLVRALEIIEARGVVPTRSDLVQKYEVKWIVIDPEKEELRARIDARLKQALGLGLIEEVRRVRENVGDARLNELGLEYKIVGEFLRENNKMSNTECLTLLLPILSAKLWQYARRQKAWLRKLGHPVS